MFLISFISYNESVVNFCLVSDFGEITMDAICLTRRVKRCIVLNNFKFREYRKLKNGNFNFRCTNKLCNASVIVSNNSGQIVD
jgi:hypothetical protein